jgi:hypothetical protein
MARATPRSRSSTSLLVAVYVKGGYLVEQDYGALALIIAFEMVAKNISRWGSTAPSCGSFHEHEEHGTLPSLTSTIMSGSHSAPTRSSFAAASRCRPRSPPNCFRIPNYVWLSG